MNKMTNLRGKRSHCTQHLGSSSSGLSLVLENAVYKEGLLTAIDRIAGESNRSETEQSLRHIFAVPADYPVLLATDDRVNLEKLQLYLQSRLRDLAPESEDSSIFECDGVCIHDSLFGEGVVVMDESSTSGEVKLKKGVLVESQAVFSSVRANASISRGKWMYEVILETAGIQQLGWATCACNFTCEAGVGDSNDSYSYDGRRVRKWNLAYYPYGEPWVTGDVIGCCIDLEAYQISFYRNGHSLGIAFDGVGIADPKLPFFPAISLSQGERCELNFGGRPFKYPVKGFKAIQAPPVLTDEESSHSLIARARYLFSCLQRLLQLDSHVVVAAMAPIERLKRLKPLARDSFVVGSEICKQLAPLLSDDLKMVENINENFYAPAAEYIIWGALLPFLMGIYKMEPPHDGQSVDKALDYLLSSLGKNSVEKCLVQVIEALAFGCRTTPVCLAECPYTGSYPFLALACHLLRRDEIITVWWRSKGAKFCLEGLLARKGTNKYDLEFLMPTVWWPGSREDICSENIMRQTVSALAKAIGKVEEMQWELCKHLLEFVPTNSTVDSSPRSTQNSESVFQTFLKYLVKKNKGAARNIPPPGLSDNSVLMTTYTVLLRLLSEGWDGCIGISNRNSLKEERKNFGFLHKGGCRKFKVKLFLDSDSDTSDFVRLGGTFSHLCKTHLPDEQDYKDIEWEEGCMDDVENRVVHDGDQKPCCCSGLITSSIIHGKGAARVLSKSFNIHFNGVYVNKGSPATSSEYNRRIFNEQVEGKPSSSTRGNAFFETLPSPCVTESVYKLVSLSDSVCEEELLDRMVLLYHLGVAPNFKQASYYLQHQLQSIAQLEDTDRQIRSEKCSSDFLKRLKESRAECKEDLVDCIRQSTWYRISLFTKWKQRGMYATCIWIVQLLLVLSEKDIHFSYVPEYYVETLLDCFHALRRSDPPFVSPMNLLQHGLASLVTFLATRFNDTRIVNSDIRDVLLQSISVLLQYKEHVVAFERNRAAIHVMPVTLLSLFDNRFWIPITNILLRLCKGSGFGVSKSSTQGEPCSPLFQHLIRECCIADERLLSSFLNRLFNTLNWTIAEFSISLKEMQESNDQRQVSELQQRKCAIMFELSCNLERLLEFFTRETPQAFLCGSEMNLVRLCELLMFVLTHTTMSADALVFDSTVRHYGHALDKVNRAMILAPLVGIILNLASTQSLPMQHNLAKAIVNADVSSIAVTNVQYLLEFNWTQAFKGDPSLARLSQLKDFLEQLKSEALVVMQEISDEALMSSKSVFRQDSISENRNDLCSICYACEVNTMFSPCKHRSCWRCISRHLLNNQRCFFCNTTVQDIRYLSTVPSNDASHSHESAPANGMLMESGLFSKNGCS